MLGRVVLALDTTTRAGSMALLRGGTLVAQRVGDAARTHGERLPGEIAALLADAGATLADVDLYAVAAGPGSFTGLRVGIAAIQGLALAQGRRVVPVSALDALAAIDTLPMGLTGCWMDAQRGQVFAALYERREDGPHLVEAAVALPPGAVLSRWTNPLGQRPIVFAGDGALRYEAEIRAEHPAATVLTPLPPLAPILGRLADAHSERAVLPHAIVPIYVRASDAELARARATGRQP
jgi:tRNA threonylcarbamoyladenosine biosynthesis protein TsaB